MCAKWEKEARWKALFVFTAVLHRLLKSPFAAAAPLFSFSKPAPPQTNNKHCQRDGHSYSSSQKFLGLFFFWGFSHDQSFWIQWTWNKSIQVSATVRKSMSGYVQWTNLMLVSGCSVCLNQCVPAGFSVTCCISLAFRTSIRHDKVTPSSGINTGAHFHLHTKGLKSSTQSSVFRFS